VADLLDIRNLSVAFDTDSGKVYAVNNLSLKIGRKETLGLVGETGAGKTTTALAVMKLIQSPPGKITSGEIVLEGQDLMRVPEKDMFNIRGNKISMIFQDPMTSLNPVMTVGEQISEVIELHQKLSKDELRKKTEEMLEVVGIRKERINDYPHQFSGGMKQRVVIAMALACNPELIIADEPTTALDVTIQAQVLELMKNLKEKYDTSMILITHDLGVVAEICDYVSVIYAGSIVEYASVKDMYETPGHPYTKGLFNSIPSLDEDVESLTTIKGNPPDPSALPSGCRFHPRCDKCMEICKHTNPEFQEVSPGHFIACHLFKKGEGESENG
jgi:oligopeptide/dipeptide ABC transporter, ATP-binding protein, C-terminal domain